MCFFLQLVIFLVNRHRHMILRFQTGTDLKPVMFYLLRFTLGLQIKSERTSLRRFLCFKYVF